MTEQPTDLTPLRVLVLAAAGSPLANLAEVLGRGYAPTAGAPVAPGPADLATPRFADAVESALSATATGASLAAVTLAAAGQRTLQVWTVDPAAAEAAVIRAAVRADVLVLDGNALRAWPSATLRAAELAMLFGIPNALSIAGLDGAATALARDHGKMRKPRHDANHQHLSTIEPSQLAGTLAATPVREFAPPGVAQHEPATNFQASCVWLSTGALLAGRQYAVRVGGEVRQARVARLRYRFDPGTARRVAIDTLRAGESGAIELEFAEPVGFNAFLACNDHGGLVFEDAKGGALGFALVDFAQSRNRNLRRQPQAITREALAELKGQLPCVLWMTGLSGAGKSTIANQLQQRLHALRYHTCLLDGDNVRHGLNRDLGFTAADRVENIRRVGEVARLMVDAGLIVITAFISPFRAEREMVRGLMREREFFEIFIDTPLAVAEQRDPKGLYRKARSGELKNFTGIDSPYQVPENPDIRVDTTLNNESKAVQLILLRLRAAGILPRI